MTRFIYILAFASVCALAVLIVTQPAPIAQTDPTTVKTPTGKTFNFHFENGTLTLSANGKIETYEVLHFEENNDSTYRIVTKSETLVFNYN